MRLQWIRSFIDDLFFFFNLTTLENKTEDENKQKIKSLSEYS